MQIETIETPSLGDRSYLVADGTVAAVIDPQRDLDRVRGVADRLGVRITAVFETHVHNDYVTGGFALARATGATYHLSVDEAVGFEHRGLSAGQTVTVGRLRVAVLHTPGHTPTHLSYVITDDEGDRAVFTGGSMLYGTVGRTDLISPDRTEELTRHQHRSVRRLADELPDPTGVHPTHGFGSFCSSAAGAEVSASTIGRERGTNLALTTDDEDEFVERLLSGLTAHPSYYAHMAPRNRQGPPAVDLSPPAAADPAEVSTRIAAGEWVVDLRPRRAFAADHRAGTINVELSDNLSTYLGWLIPWTTPVTLLGDGPDDVARAQRQLARIGIDRPAAAATGGPDAWADDGPRGSYEVTDFAGLAARRRDGRDPVVLDTRRDDEWAEGAVTGAVHIPLHDLQRRADELPDDGPVWIHCAGGFRAAIGASLLARTGRQPVLIDDDYDHAVELGLTGPTD